MSKEFENALDVSREFKNNIEGKNLLTYVVRALLGIWRELDTISALYREAQSKCKKQ